MVIEHPYDKKLEDVFRKVSIELQLVGDKEPVTGIVHVEKGLRLSDHLNRGTSEFLIVTNVQFAGREQDVLFIRKEQIKVIFPT